MPTVVVQTGGPVSCTSLADGMVVRMAGALLGEQLPAVRSALLSPLTPSCRDVVVDAGDVTEVDGGLVPLLLDACAWAERHGARLRLSRSSWALDEALLAAEALDQVPRLTPLSRRVITIPEPRQPLV
jgi:anti-anti-sigma regulatory factor